jgi:hypothetical protein
VEIVVIGNQTDCADPKSRTQAPYTSASLQDAPPIAQAHKKLCLVDAAPLLLKGMGKTKMYKEI